MNEKTKQLVKNLLSCAGKKCDYMTHNLSELGGGNMAEGLVTLYRSGRLNGIVIGAGSVTALVASYHVGKAVIEGIKTQSAIRKLAHEQEAHTVVLPGNDATPTAPCIPADNTTGSTDTTTITESNTDSTTINT